MCHGRSIADSRDEGNDLAGSGGKDNPGSTRMSRADGGLAVGAQRPGICLESLVVPVVVNGAGATGAAVVPVVQLVSCERPSVPGLPLPGAAACWAL